MRNTPAYAHFAEGGRSPPKLDDEGSLVVRSESRILQNAPWHAPARFKQREAPEGIPAGCYRRHRRLGVNDYEPVH